MRPSPGGDCRIFASATAECGWARGGVLSPALGFLLLIERGGSWGGSRFAFDSSLTQLQTSPVGSGTCDPALHASPSPRGPGPGHEAHLLLLQLTGGGMCYSVWEDGHGAGVQALW